MIYKKTLILTSPESEIDFNGACLNVTKLRVEGFRYSTASSGGREMVIKIDSFLNTGEYISNSVSNDYTIIMLLDSGSGMLVRYVNKDTQSFDCILNNQKDIKNFRVKCLINNAVNYDVSPSNPVVLELHFE